MEDSSKNSERFIEKAPGFLKEILPYVSPTLFEIIDLPQASIKMAKLSYQFLFDRGVGDVSDGLKNHLPENIILDEFQGEVLQEMSDKEFGEKVLEFFFTQIFAGQSMFLDLRKDNFQRKGQVIQFIPNGLHYTFSREFIEGLRKLYVGFYLEQDQTYEEGLREVGLISASDSDEVINEMKTLFKNHFGEGDQTSVHFEISKFTDSFQAVFKHVFHQRKRLPVEFAFLGIYLVTLYLNLGEIEEGLDVRASFMKVHSAE